MAFSKITNEERQGKGNVGQPDTPLLTATEMQEQMDSLANLGIDKFNTFIDEISDPSASSNIGCTPPASITTTNRTLFGVLTAIADIANTSDALAHNHANKETLDTLTETLVDELVAINTMLTGITSISSTITDDATKIPSCKGVVDYIKYNAQFSIALMDRIYPIGAVYATTTLDPDTVFGTTGKWTSMYEDSHGVTYYKRTS